MTNSQKVMLGCIICIDAHVLHGTLMEWRNRHNVQINQVLAKLELDIAIFDHEKTDSTHLQEQCLNLCDCRNEHRDKVHTDESRKVQRQQSAIRKSQTK